MLLKASEVSFLLRCDKLILKRSHWIWNGLLSLLLLLCGEQFFPLVDSEKVRILQWLFRITSICGRQLLFQYWRTDPTGSCTVCCDTSANSAWQLARLWGMQQYVFFSLADLDFWNMSVMQVLAQRFRWLQPWPLWTANSLCSSNKMMFCSNISNHLACAFYKWHFYMCLHVAAKKEVIKNKNAPFCSL